MIVTNHKECVLVLGGVILLPGTNVIEGENAGHLLEDRYFLERKESGIVSVVKGTEDPLSDLSSLPVKKAVEVVKTILDRSWLKNKMQTEERPLVAIALKSQFDELSKPEVKE